MAFNILVKICSKCKTTQSVDNFSSDKTHGDGKKSVCKLCRSTYEKEWYKNNKKRHRKNTRRWAKNNPEKIYRAQKRFKIEHPERVRFFQQRYFYSNKESLYKYRNDRYKNNPNVKIANVLRSRLNSSLKNFNTTNNHIKYLGCSIDNLKIYLENMFLPGMLWDNWTRTGWHIDHIIPLCKFDLIDEDQLKQACHYTNLQPLWAKDNFKKGGI